MLKIKHTHMQEVLGFTNIFFPQIKCFVREKPWPWTLACLGASQHSEVTSPAAEDSCKADVENSWFRCMGWGQLLPCQYCSVLQSDWRYKCWWIPCWMQEHEVRGFFLWSGWSREWTLFFHRCNRGVMVTSTVHNNNFGTMMLFNPGLSS